jgi:hypothetical protein
LSRTNLMTRFERLNFIDATTYEIQWDHPHASKEIKQERPERI